MHPKCLSSIECLVFNRKRNEVNEEIIMHTNLSLVATSVSPSYNSSYAVTSLDAPETIEQLTQAVISVVSHLWDSLPSLSLLPGVYAESSVQRGVISVGPGSNWFNTGCRKLVVCKGGRAPWTEGNDQTICGPYGGPPLQVIVSDRDSGCGAPEILFDGEVDSQHTGHQWVRRGHRLDVDIINKHAVASEIYVHLQEC